MIINNKKVGVYVRPWNNEYYFTLAKKTFPNHEIITISEFKRTSALWSGEGLYSNATPKILDFDVMNEIHYRCRFLRGLPIGKSFDIINKIYYYFTNLFDIYDFQYFIGALVDNYTLDIISRICKERNVPYISLVGHFINGYSRFSIKGELVNLCRDVSDYEVERVLLKLAEDSYVPNFDFNKQKSYLGSMKYYYKERIKEASFTLLKYMLSDPLNYHYNTLILKGINKRNIISKKIIREFVDISKIPIDDMAVYLPLHYTPEATVDYWSEQYECALYEMSILQMIRKSSKEIKFLIKEHPAMFLKRNLDFYKQLKQYSNVVLVHPYASSNQILKQVKNVYVYTGSVGVEALIRGKRVFTKTENYYSKLNSNIHQKDFLQVEDLNQKINPNDNKEMVRSLLKSLIPGKFVNNRRIDSSDTDVIVEYIHVYLKQNFSDRVGDYEKTIL